MNVSNLRPYRGLFLALAIFGFLVINVPFLYFAFIDTMVYDAAMENGVALLLMGEGFILMIFFAFLISRLGWKRPGWILFIVFSLVGSLAFSVPLMLYIRAGKDE